MTHSEEAEPSWSQQMSRAVGVEVRRARKAAGISAERLADLCTNHGLPIKRHVITSLEIGRRENVSVAEVVAIATVLNVPVATLIYPVVETPLATGPTWLGSYGPAVDGADWFTGHTRFPGTLESEGIGLVATEESLEASRLAWYGLGLGSSLRAFMSRLENNLRLLDQQFLDPHAEASDEDEFTFSQVEAALSKLVGVHNRLVEVGAEIPPVTELFDLHDLSDKLAALLPVASPEVEPSAQSLLDDVLAVINSEGRS